MAVLLLSWAPSLDALNQQFDILDYFAGKALISRSARRMGLGAAAIDIDYGNPRAMDMTSAAGFAFLILFKVVLQAVVYMAARYRLYRS